MTLRRFLVAGALALGAIASARSSEKSAPDAMHGEQVYARCMACHALTYDRVGSRHCGLFGRLAGSVPQFNYSPAMKNSGIVWSDKTLDRFLTKPLKMVPGSSMTYDGVSDPKERADLIAYLKHVNETPECRKLASVKQ
ncbi:MAG TPA: c-type cytochrome [Burkholderiaceae bacterium]